ncbi:hypothetical protein JB92DRAFT_2838626 [Gautieria morchelliformis]|nr:hypothetical protein JB92DRAFT_2838626 [Gautieria morchelliformis]
MPISTPPLLITAILEGLIRKHALAVSQSCQLMVFAMPQITNPLNVHSFYEMLEAHITQLKETPEPTTAMHQSIQPQPLIPTSDPCSASGLAIEHALGCTDDGPPAFIDLCPHEHIYLPCIKLPHQSLNSIQGEILKHSSQLDLDWAWEDATNYRNLMREITLVGPLACRQFRIDIIASLHRIKPLTLRRFSVQTTRKYLPPGSALLVPQAVGRNAILRRWVYENLDDLEHALMLSYPPLRPGRHGMARATCAAARRGGINFWALVENWFEEKASRWGRDLTAGPWIGEQNMTRVVGRIKEVKQLSYGESGDLAGIGRQAARLHVRPMQLVRPKKAAGFRP